MTANELYRRHVILCIGARTPHLPPVKFPAVYEKKRRAWLKAKAAEAETEYIRRLLAPFRRVEVLKTPGRVIDLTALPEGVVAVRAVVCDFLTPEGRLPGRSCTALTDDRLTEEGNPAARGDDWFPRYLEEAETTLTIYSDTAPSQVTVRYLRSPDPIGVLSASSTGGAELLENDDAIDEILMRLDADDALTDGHPTYSALTRQEIPQREQNP